MSAATTRASGAQRPPPALFGEWFWRFLAVVMLFIVGWVVWIAIQISPPDVFLPAAYEAAAQGRALRNAAGPISGAAPALPAAPAGDPPQVAGAPAAPPEAAPVPAAPSEPPVNLEKLRLADSIETPIPERSKRAAKPAADGTK